MGIYNINRVCKDLLEKASIKIPKDLDCKIYVDGLVVWYCGHLSEQLNKRVATKKLTTVLNQLEFEFKFNVKRIKIYFDGTPPAYKKNSQNYRPRLARAIESWGRELMFNDKRIQVVRLQHGEAESECFFQRNGKLASIIITNDTDIYHIVYRYQRLTVNDNVYFYIIDKKELFDASLFETILNKNAFKLLIFLRGSDYNDPLFTPQMVKSILDLINSKKNFNIDDNRYFKIINKINDIMTHLTPHNINKCICYFILLLGFIKNRSDEVLFEWPRFNENFILKEYYKLLMWMINYSNIGRNIRDYNDKVIDNNDRIEKFLYLTNIFQESFKTKSMDFTEMKSYEEFEEIIDDIFISEINEASPDEIKFNLVIE
ncbi:GSCOCT00014060001.2-RA-CDS [Cotesia congregata]|uniref:Cc_fen1_3a n=1 Tax=Cotesia congregata TaxID=51543 RepID=A0A8J2MU58_COTCN|nr:GSCOCT00014060001.2-RA-CDS [Cotesia congregata]CAG5095874.1 Cc_fen1_3a [Cotesia congregata]